MHLSPSRDDDVDLHLRVDVFACVLDEALDALQSSTMYMKLWRETGTVKLPAVQEYIFDMLDRDELTKILVFAHHQHVLDGLESTLWNKACSHDVAEMAMCSCLC